MKLSCCVWALTLPENELLNEVKSIGFDWIDIQPHMLQTADTRSLAELHGFKVSCVGASFGLPEGISLDAMEESNRQLAVDHTIQTIALASDLGADTVYVVPGLDTSPASLAQFASSVRNIADRANDHHIKICIEHFPGRALPTASVTLAFIESVNHPNLYLLYDSGHVQMANEDPSDIILKAGSKLGYVHFDDNDGINDSHLSLLDGVMTMDDLNKTFHALHQIGYDGAISLELNPTLPSPKQSLIASREILLGLMEAE